MNISYHQHHATNTGWWGLAWRIVFLMAILTAQVPVAQGELPELQDSRTVFSDEYGYHDSQSTEVLGGQVNADVSAGTSGNLELGSDGLKGEIQGGVAVQVDGEWTLDGIGDDQFGADASVRAELEAVLGAKGAIGAYIDETGITIGAEVEAGAYISAGIELGLDIRVFGVETNVKVRAEAAAGIQASAQAMVHIGFDGNVEFSLGAGLVVGIGAQFGIEFSLNAESLMRALGLGDDMFALIDWVSRFQADPEAYLGDLIGSVGDAVLHKLSWGFLGREFDAGASFGAANYEAPNMPAPPTYRPPQAKTAQHVDSDYDAPANLQLTPYESPGPYQWPAPLSW